VDYVTAVGDDPLSERMMESWRAEGIGTDLVRQLAGELPGLYWIQNRADGEREFLYWRSASAARQIFRDGGVPLAGVLQKEDLLYLSGISLAILPGDQRAELLEAVTRLRRDGVRIAYDSNYRPRLWTTPEEARDVYLRVLADVDVFITSFQDESALLGDRGLNETADRLMEYDVQEWVIRGKPGVTVTRHDGAISSRPVDPAAVLDTTGAGDSFDAAYLSARLLGFDCARAVSAGHALAGVVVQHRGAIVPAASTPTLAALLAG
jgi:2-dehydro-3-deoxygluconokinase